MSYYLAPELLPKEKPVCLGHYLDKQHVVALALFMGRDGFFFILIGE